MPITVLLDPAEMPGRTQDQETFDNAVANVMQKLPTLGQQINATEAGMNSIAAGGAYKLPYLFDAGTAAGDPGAGEIRLNNANLTLVTAIYVSTTSAAGKAVGGILSSMSASSSSVKGTLRLVGSADDTRYAMYNLTSIDTSNANYYVLSVGYVSTLSPVYAAGEQMLLSFQRTGDKGDVGTGYLTLLGQATVSSTVANVDFLSICTSAYDKYLIEIEGLQSDSAGNLALTLANGGVVDTAANYYNWAANATNISTTAVNRFTGASVGSSGVTSGTVTIELRNTNSASKMKSVGVRGVLNLSAVLVEGAYAGGVVSGFRLSLPTSNIAAGTIRVYGFKNT